VLFQIAFDLFCWHEGEYNGQKRRGEKYISIKLGVKKKKKKKNRVVVVGGSAFFTRSNRGFVG